MVAVRLKDVAFVVMLAGPGLPGAEILTLQSNLIGHAMGMPEEKLAHANAVNKQLYAALAAARDGKAAEAKVRAILSENASVLDSRGPSDVEVAVKEITSPWFSYFVKYDPRPVLGKVKCPMLALNGEKDVQVPPKENLAEIKKANPRAKTIELPGLNHLFQTAQTRAPHRVRLHRGDVRPGRLDGDLRFCARANEEEVTFARALGGLTPPERSLCRRPGTSCTASPPSSVSRH